MAFVFSNTISKPIVSMVNSMKTVGDNNFQVDIDYRGDDEFGYLFSQYKSMISQIRDLIDKLYISEMHKQRAEIDVKNAQLEALQTQINPHFLYNTLDSINLYAIKYNAPVICEMIDSLANFFRYTLSGGRAVISLDEEITHTKSYLKLQSLRMGGSLRYHFDIPGELRSVRIVKLTIQPLVENSIKHGFDTNKGVIEIDVSARRENDAVKIIIQDNGTGADISRLEGMLARDGHSASFAVGNVHNRIQNTFGREYGLSYQKREGGGLSVEIRIPLYSGEGEGSEHS
jgi:two-component system sensor histidine kinase YesM